MKIALCLFGLPRYSEEIIETLKTYLLNHEQVDIYAHLWWSENMIGKYKHREFYDVWEADTIEKLKALLPFKKLEIEPQKIFDVSHLKAISNEPDIKHLDASICKDIQFSNMSKWYSTHRAYSLIDNPEEYDFIIINRMDSHYTKPINFEALQTNKLYLQDGYNSGGDRKYSDICAIGSPSTIKHYAEIYKHTEKYHKEGLIHLHKHFEQLMKTDIPVPHEPYPFGIWIFHPSLYKKKRPTMYITNDHL